MKKPFGLFEITGTYHKMSDREQKIVNRKLGIKPNKEDNNKRRKK